MSLRERSSPRGGLQPSMSRALRLLVVDDQPRARQSLAALLATSFPGIEISEAADGQEAVDCVDASRPDIVVTDARMPVLDGIAATRLIKARHPETKVIILSMYTGYRGAALAAGADAFVSKGASPDVLLATLASFVSP